MLKCRDVADQADGYLDGALPWRTRAALRLHLVLCHHCRRYLRQLRALLRAIPFMHPRASDDEVARVMAGLEPAQDR